MSVPIIDATFEVHGHADQIDLKVRCQPARMVIRGMELVVP